MSTARTGLLGTSMRKYGAVHIEGLHGNRSDMIKHGLRIRPEHDGVASQVLADWSRSKVDDAIMGSAGGPWIALRSASVVVDPDGFYRVTSGDVSESSLPWWARNPDDPAWGDRSVTFRGETYQVRRAGQNEYEITRHDGRPVGRFLADQEVSLRPLHVDDYQTVLDVAESYLGGIG